MYSFSDCSLCNFTSFLAVTGHECKEWLYTGFWYKPPRSKSDPYLSRNFCILCPSVIVCYAALLFSLICVYYNVYFFTHLHTLIISIVDYVFFFVWPNAFVFSFLLSSPPFSLYFMDYSILQGGNVITTFTTFLLLFRIVGFIFCCENCLFIFSSYVSIF